MSPFLPCSEYQCGDLIVRGRCIEKLHSYGFAYSESREMKQCELCPAGEGRGPLQHVGQNLKKVAENVHELNQENGILIKQSLGLIATTIAIMRSAPEADLPTYTPSGTMNTKTEDPGFVSQKRSLSREA